ncbi:hypothetical protein ACFVZC_32225 [Streptomyces marokkonensis]|uniref:Integrase n=1 Tax=Streptomyces marokkonensis TaxID=324855 RepID=A0ABW6QFY8_9ACTN
MSNSAVPDGGDIVEAELVDDRPPRAELATADRDRHLSPETAAAIAASVAASTRRAYGADRKAFAAWCAAEGRTTVPASAETMAEWVRHLTVTRGPAPGGRPDLHHRARPVRRDLLARGTEPAQADHARRPGRPQRRSGKVAGRGLS